jgi:hypothetical protein
MSADKDVMDFANAIDASEPSPDSENYRKWKAIFKRSNYFILNKKFMIVKISRSKKPFWGVGKEIIDLLNMTEEYYLILLTSSREGWVFTKSEINANIKSKKWNLREADNNYKINFPLPDRNSFLSPKNCLKKLGFDENAT